MTIRTAEQMNLNPLFSLLIVAFSLGVIGCKSPVKEHCTDTVRPELEQCKGETDRLQREINTLKRQLAQALANPGTIKVDPSALLIDGKYPEIKKEEGTLSQEQVIAVMKQNKPVLQACYERAMKKNTALTQQKITVTVGFFVKSSGIASDITISPNYDSTMIDCMKKAIVRWKFPQFTGQPVGVESPLTLTPRK